MKDLRIRRTLDGDKSDESFKAAFIERLQRPNVVSPDESWITEILYTTFNEFFFCHRFIDESFIDTARDLQNRFTE